MERWAPGAHLEFGATRFAVFATTAERVAIRLFDDDGSELRTEPLDALGAGRFEKRIRGVGRGATYKIVLDGDELPDPYARWLPHGVHGVARVEPRGAEPALATPLPLEKWVIYELHIGTFTELGTYVAAIGQLDAVAAVGVNAIEIMPVTAFAGARGWGYDGVALYAPHAAYGEPDDLRALVRAAHARGLAVILDVVYNHFGPAGNYLARFAPEYFDSAVKTPWGPAPDFGHAPMRELVLDNVRYWFDELGFDALRLDATHAIVDESRPHVLRAIADEAHARGRFVFFEDERNDPAVVLELGADAVWADDFHHCIHVLLTGERDGYYAAYEQSVERLARTIERGWAFEGEPYPPWNGRPRGKPAVGALQPAQLVYCLQNHDQIGNRALGDRLSEDVDGFEAASVLLLFLPSIPLLFMGQEWGATSPFLFFSDHDGEVGANVSRGRREEFASFAAFADPRRRDAIPDPQAVTTFSASKLRWDEPTRDPHARLVATYRAMLALRSSDVVLSFRASFGDLTVTATGKVLDVRRRAGDDERRLLVNFGDALAHVDIDGYAGVFSTRPLDGSRIAPHAAVLLAPSRSPPSR